LVGRRDAPRLILVTALVLAVGAVIVIANPGGMGVRTPPADGQGSATLDRPFLNLLHPLLVAAAFALAGSGFARGWRRQREGFLAWLAVAAASAAAYKIMHFALPPAPPGWMHAGDAFRLAMHLALVLAAGCEVRREWREHADTAAERERRRIAGDLHDHVAQELAFIKRRAERLARSSDAALVREILDATARALEGSRQAMSAVTVPRSGDCFEAVLRRAARDAAARTGIPVSVAIGGAADASPDVCEAAARIIGEAVANAARHGAADSVRVELSADGRLVVADDGVGFDVGRQRPGFGLVSMRERAQAIGGALEVRSAPGHGTEIIVQLPGTGRRRGAVPARTA
jgi:signal transduction histidine kinase